MDRKLFYNALRAQPDGMFGRRLTASQVRGMEGVIDAFASYGDGRVQTLAYALATARHEVGAGMVPVREGFKKTDAAARRYVMANYGHKGKSWYCYPAGAFSQVYYGRGYVQLTWLDNYQEQSKRTGVDLVRDPDGALDPKLSAQILIKGLLSGTWNGRGHGIAYYLPTDGRQDLRGARRTVNITDRWQIVAGYYDNFLAAILAAGGVPAAVADDPAPVAHDWFGALLAAFLKIFKKEGV